MRTSTIDEADILIRSLSMTSLAADAELADLTAPEPAAASGSRARCRPAGRPRPALQAGLQHSTRPATQASGTAPSRFRARNNSYAIFGTPGVDDKVFAPASTFPVPAEWIDELAHR